MDMKEKTKLYDAHLIIIGVAYIKMVEAVDETTKQTNR